MPTDPEALLPTAVLDAALIAKVDSLRALLREVEWSGYGSFGSSRRIKGACPTCLGIEPETYDGHLQGLRSWEKPPKSAMRGHAPDYRLDAELR